MQAYTIVLDIGSHMSNIPAPGYEKPLESALESLKSYLTRNIFAQSKDEMALILVGTDETNNLLADENDGSFENISLVQELGRIDWDIVEYLSKVEATNQNADLIDGIVLAAHHLVEKLKGRKGTFRKRIVAVSNLAGDCNHEMIDRIIKKLKKAEIELFLIGGDLPDDDDDEDDDGGDGGARGDAAANHGAANRNNARNKRKSQTQIDNEQLFAKIIREMDGVCYNFEEATQALSNFQLRSILQRAWKADLTLGAELSLPVLGYTSVSEARPISFKNVYARDPEAKVEQERTYNLNDEAETEVQVEETVKGFRYGSTLVPFNEDDLANMKYRAEKSLSLLGFTELDNVGFHLRSGNSTIVFVADPAGGPAGMESFAALVHALHEMGCAAIVRRVYNKASQPRIAALAPKFKLDAEGNHIQMLVFTELPYSEDVRSFVFPSLPVGGADAEKYKPSQEQLDAMDKLIDDMNLQHVPNSNGDLEEVCKPKQMLNPFVQYLYRCAAARIQEDDATLPDEPAAVTSYLDPPRSLETAAAASLSALPDVFPTKKIERKKAVKVGEAVFGEEESAAAAAEGEPDPKRPRTEVTDVARVAITEVGSVSPLDDFEHLLNRGETETAFRGLGARASQLVENSFGEQFYPKALSCVHALRKAAVRLSSAETFNQFLEDWRTSLKSNKKDFWKLLCQENITLISNSEVATSKITPQEAAGFIKEETPVEAVPAQADDNVDDLFDDME